MPALLLGLVLAGPVVLVDNVSSEKEVPKSLGATLDPLMCNHFEKAFKWHEFKLLVGIMIVKAFMLFMLVHMH